MVGDDLNAVRFIHILSSFLLFASSFSSLLLRWTAALRSNAAEIVILIKLVQPMLIIMIISMTFNIAFGFRAAVENGHTLASTWLIASYCFVAYILFAVDISWKYDTQTRQMAEKLSIGSAEIHVNIRKNSITPAGQIALAAQAAIAAMNDKNQPTATLRRSINSMVPFLNTEEGILHEDTVSANQESAELKARLVSPLNWTINLSILASLIVIIALMVFQPGGSGVIDSGYIASHDDRI